MKTHLFLERIKERILQIPQQPGVYLIKDRQGHPDYIGKARNLRGRLKTHFQSSSARELKEYLIQKDAADIGVVLTATEAEALLLEASLVKQHRPKYNKELKDDKSYPFLKITMAEDYPRLLIARGRTSDGSLYFGPYTNVGLLRQAVAHLRRVFPMRTCHPLAKKVCLMYHIGQCQAPCVGDIDRKKYREIVKELVLFLEGKKSALLRVLHKRMVQTSKERRFEEAKLYRDQIQSLSTVSMMRSPMNRLAVLKEMMDVFHLSSYPRRIEAFDISNFSGKNPVGSLVVFVDGAPLRSEYRRFKIKTVEGIDDYKMMREIVRRRYERVLSEKLPLPDVILIDGGKGHLASAKDELNRLNLTDLDVLSIAKQHEIIFKPSRHEPYVLPQHSAVLQLIRHLRDEAHRFAITFYRKLHESVSEGICDSRTLFKRITSEGRVG